LAVFLLFVDSFIFNDMSYY